MKTPAWPIFLLLIFGLSACDKPNPTPENADPIYSDLLKAADELKKAIPEAKKSVEEAQLEMTKVKPQTGQIEYAKKRLYEAAARLTKIEQMAKYAEIRAESRMKFDREEYSKAWVKDRAKSWPDPKEYEQFREAEAAARASSNWVNKANVAAALKKAAKKDAEAKKAETKPE